MALPAELSSDPKRLLRAGVRELSLDLAPATIQKFLLYLKELQKWNTRINLTALKTAPEIIHKHFLDSLALAPWIQDLANLADLGAGAGFPGLPLKLVFPTLALTLVEATGKKVAFLRYLTVLLQLPDVEVRQCYLTPALARAWGPCCQGVISRATFPLAQLMALGSPLLQPGGRLMALKGPHFSEAEWQEAIRQARRLGLGCPEQHQYTLPLSDEPRKMILLTRMSPLE